MSAGAAGAAPGAGRTRPCCTQQCSGASAVRIAAAALRRAAPPGRHAGRGVRFATRALRGARGVAGGAAVRGARLRRRNAPPQRRLTCTAPGPREPPRRRLLRAAACSRPATTSRRKRGSAASSCCASPPAREATSVRAPAATPLRPRRSHAPPQPSSSVRCPQTQPPLACSRPMHPSKVRVTRVGAAAATAGQALIRRLRRCAGFQELTVAQLAARMQAGGLLLLDVRSADEFARGCAARRVSAALLSRRGVTRRPAPDACRAR